MPELLFSFAIGAFCGCRTTVPTAAICWLAYLHIVDADGTWFSFLARPVCVVVMTLAVMGELVVDKLPITPSRLEAPLLVGRMCAGAFTGAVLATVMRSHRSYGVLLGVSGALLGALIGYWLRTRTVTRFRLPDYVVALTEDGITIAGSAMVVLLANASTIVC